MSEERDTRSYSERYAPTPPPAPPAPEGGGPGSRTLAMIGVGLLVAALVGALILRATGSGPTANGPTPVPTASSTPRPTPGPLDLAYTRFWTVIADPNLSYHLETLGGGKVGSQAYTFKESIDISGDSWSGVELAHGMGSESAVQIVTLDTVVWVKFPNGWHRNIQYDPYFRSRPFLGLDSQRDLSPFATVVKNGQTLYDLKSTTNYQPYAGRLIGFVQMGLQVDTLEFDILVTDQGVPVEATVHILAGGLGLDGKPQLDASATRTFTEVGATFTITAPKT